ncbi:MAG: TolC family protein, partial [Myxococcales bacterium]|nr:TolC family protein [Myxococcales bacterium]
MDARRPLLALLLTVGCAHELPHDDFHDELEARTGARADQPRSPGDAAELPEGVSLADGLDRDEAVAVALANNPSLRAALTGLDVADAELAAARRPSNPNLRLLFPIGPASFTALIAWPIESLATMPGRINRAHQSQDAAAAAALTTSLDLVRDVRLAHADAVLAQEVLDLRAVLVEERRASLEILEAQARLGELPEAQVETARADLALVVDDHSRAETELALALSRLRTQIGWGLDPIALTLASEPVAELPAG